MSFEVEIILCVPGNWPDRSALVAQVAASNLQQYLYAGLMMLHLPTGNAFELEVQEADSRLRRSFEVAGQGRFTGAELDAIGSHQQVVYLIGPGGSREAAQAMMEAAGALLNAGGRGVKVETCGKAFTPAQWRELTAETEAYKFYQALVVTLADEAGGLYTCGMHNLGLPDAAGGRFEALEASAELLDTFNLYQLIDEPEIESGQTFSLSADAPVYRILAEPCRAYEPEHPFYNPFGVYRLQELPG